MTAPCPNCSKEIQYIYQTERIPYFAEVMFASAVCDCGFKSVETYVMGDGEPVRYTFRVENADDLSARVIRSSSAEMRIPEFGIEVTPGPMCEAFISNVEGVLLRMSDALDTIARTATDEEKEKIAALKEKLDAAREGNFEFTLVIEDMSGNSGIVSRKAAKEILPKTAQETAA